MKILITGVTGFVGSHLAEYLLSLGDHEIFGLCRWRSNRENLSQVYDKINLFDADLSDLGSLIRQIDAIKPDVIFHLAAQSYVLSSFNAPTQTLWTNVIGTTNLLEAVRINGIDPIIHVCSSSEVYGQVAKENVPITEDCPFRPASPYAVSKVGEDMIALQYWLTHKLKTIRTRMFTHTGPRRGDVFFASFFAKQIAASELKLKDPVISVGNLDSVRTICDVRDAVKAYWLLVNKCTAGDVYNIGGNRTMKVGEVLDMLLAHAKVKCEIKVDPNLLRPSDVTSQIPCIDKFTSITGWSPQISPEKTAEDMLQFWRKELEVSPWKAVTIVK
ncbi:MAG: GDP-mannose 4,6-dehydratase [Candidatus Omnitrophica bacterium]|nr:GDP-mannose 4,6-dehydratase [Candidatus Omnitrophota bacterium]